MTRQYFAWMNQEFKTVCNCSIEEITGMSVEDYIMTAMDVISPKNQANALFYLLIDQENAVAMGGLRQLPNGHGEIVRIYTSPEYRSKGYGSKMLERLILEAKAHGFKMLNLDTGIFMKEAQAMYAAHGFVQCTPYEGAEPPPQLQPFWLYMQLDLQKS